MLPFSKQPSVNNATENTKMYYSLLNKIFPNYFSDLNIDLKYFCAVQYNIKKILKEMNDIIIPVNLDNLTEVEIYFYHKVINRAKKFITIVLTPSKKIITTILDTDKVLQKKFLSVVRSKKYQFISPYFMIDSLGNIINKIPDESNPETKLSTDTIYDTWLKEMKEHHEKFIFTYGHYKKIFSELFAVYVLTCPLDVTSQVDHRFNLLNDISRTMVKFINDLTELWVVDQSTIISQLIEPYISIDILQEEFVNHI